MPDIDFSKIAPRDLMAIRQETYNNLFDRAKKLRRKATETGSVDDIDELLIFCRDEYVPYIRTINGAAIKYPITNRAKGTLSIASGISALTAVGAGFLGADVIALVAGGIGVSTFSASQLLDSVSETSRAVNSASKSGLLTIERFEWFDRYFLHEPRRQAAMNDFKRRLAILDQQTRGF
jgi:hypothetical protein